MPVSYKKSMTPQEHFTAIATLLARTDLKRFNITTEELVSYAIPAKRLLEKDNLLILPYMEQMLTSRCTLRCTYCANLMQYYCPDQQHTWTFEECAHNLERLLDCVDYIVWFRLLGGEPLLIPWLPDLVRFALSQPKIGRVEVVTNGTLIPSAELQSAMQNPRASFDLSNYGPVSRKIPEIIKMAQAQHIRYSINPSYTWEDMGDMTRRDYSEERVRQIYATCDNICKNLVGTEIHVCPRSSNGMLLGLIPRCPHDYVDIWENEPDTVKYKLRRLFNRTHIQACYYCNAPEYRSPIPAGEQMAQPRLFDNTLG